jgi:nicotinamidase-related amidase
VLAKILDILASTTGYVFQSIGGVMISTSADPNNFHGQRVKPCAVALLMIDVINDLDFPESEQLLRYALPMAKRLLKLKRQVKELGIPVIYVNDNFGQWQSNLPKLVRHCLNDSQGKPLVELLQPDEDDYFIVKPRHSGFFGTSLDLLLGDLEVETLILTGLAGNICVFFTANDAYLRHYKLIVPRDCIASNTQEMNDAALMQMQQILKANTSSSTELKLQKLLAK